MVSRIPFDESSWQDYLAGQAAHLPHLPQTQCLTARVTRILGNNPGPMSLQGTNTYLVGLGSSRILIDTGEGDPGWISAIVDVLTESQIHISHVLLTHWHGDHTGGVPDIITHDPKLVSHVYKNKPDPGQLHISDGQVFRVNGATLRAVFTPGHAIDHMCFLLEEENALFTGDNVLGHGYSVVLDLSEYMQSLARMAALQCTTGYPGHGARIDDMPAKMREYIHHKESRVEHVFRTLPPRKTTTTTVSPIARGTSNSGGMTLAQIVQSIYGDVPPQLVETVLAPFLTQALWKLAEDQRVGFEPGERELTKRRWFATGSQRVRKARDLDGKTHARGGSDAL
ncbi:hypothetical protein VPNG_02625 [Cytospora leucostoma]|uniref:Metallo-beta-lactamase domain-containing protein n=1 Tax=Cytospora leucostoma TaxID=1230097 RepID=A0A423XI94_9PEZI|nr:hypothetical protein VPNG_02625 [Cytospora leucostoma]